MTGFLDDKVLPVDIRPDAKFAAAFSTSIITLRSGGEYRNGLWAHPLRTFEVEYGARDPREIEESVMSFLMSTMGALYGFRARDWSDHIARAASVGEGDGSTWWFRLVKPYGDYSRRIRKPDRSAAVSVAIDGVPLAPSQYAVDYDQGVLVLKTAPGSGTEVSWTGKFHVPVRFTDDTVSVAMAYHRVGSVDRFGLTEIRIRDTIDTAALATLRGTL